MLAGVSVDYYARLERGDLAGASESVLEAVARALQLDDDERQYLYNLARSGDTPPRRRRRPKPAATPRPAVLGILAGMTTIPAYVRNARLDIVAANRLCQALYGGSLTTTSSHLTWPGMSSSSRTPAVSLSIGTAWPTTWPARYGSRPGAAPVTVP
jgi:transcriptional regulator with XRE-family HTH domain